ncbi:MAG: hypothetical protein KF869_00725 [Phycisphaeraceae bacterium]|nr:hypothetical protein [Phycisphaeraceae bacterium]
MNNAPDNLDIATRDRVDLLVSRIADSEATPEDWGVFNDLAERHPWAWRDLARAQRDHAAMCAAVSAAVEPADFVTLPVRAGGRGAGASPSRMPMIGWGGWAVAACLALVFFGGVRPAAPVSPVGHAAGVNLASWTPDDFVKGYVDAGQRSGLVMGEVPQRVLIESRALGPNEGFEVVYVRQFVERARVRDLVRFAADEAGRPMPVRAEMPAAAGRPE